MKLLLSILLLSTSVYAQSNYLAYTTTKYPRNSEGDLIVLNDSTYLVAYSQFFTGTDDFDKAQISAVKTIDSGKTWTSLGVLQPNVGLQTTNSASFVRCANGDILLFYLVGNSITDLKCWVRRSENNGNTFGAASIVTDSAGYWILNNARAVKTSGGRIVLPFSYSPNISQSYGTNPVQPIRSRCIYSDDNGATWQKSAAFITAPMRGAMEPGIVELSANNLLMYIRTQTGVQYYSTSSNNGATWSASYAGTLVSPEVPVTIVKNNGVLIAVHNPVYNPAHHHFGSPTPLTVSKSTNDGVTWQIVKNIEDRKYHEFSYTSIAINNGYMLLTYFDRIAENNQRMSVKYRKIKLSDLGL